MSRVHTRFRRTHLQETRATYSVFTADYSSQKEEEEIAQIEFDLNANTFLLIPKEPWIRERGLPPHLYAIDEASRATYIEREFAGYGARGTSSHIYRFASEVLLSKEFSEERFRVT